LASFATSDATPRTLKTNVETSFCVAFFLVIFSSTLGGRHRQRTRRRSIRLKITGKSGEPTMPNLRR
jgi:hypothetical protein